MARRPDVQHHRVAPAPSREEGYAALSKRPLQILLFLSPLIIAYELALIFVLDRGEAGTVTVAAHRAILRLLQEMGFPPSTVLSLGGIALAVLLLAWHVLRRDRWRADPMVAVGMAAESMVLAIPLLAVATLLADAGTMAAAASMLAPAAPAGEIVADSAGSAADAAATGAPGVGIAGAIAISIGAGLYEELFFRWMLIAVLHTLLVDVARMADRTGTAIAVIASAIAFTFYHDLSPAADAAAAPLVVAGIDVPRAAFLAIAGLYFGAVYAVRGFGIVVGLHATYDIVTVVLEGPAAIRG
ncbi:MAG: CPBP family glutamic-type intramembrane protease [Planctomycetota bacterium]|jgi:membrane protease YdiL (CAAX protease family)